MKPTREDTVKNIWKQLQNSKFKEFYIYIQLTRIQERDRYINIFLAIVTSSSVAAWAIWENNYLKWIWAVIIAASQILLLIKPHLNFSKYTKEMYEKFVFLKSVNIDYEKLWLDYKYDRINTDEALDILFELRKKLSSGFVFSEDIILKENKKIYTRAKEELGRYLKINF